LTWYPCKPNPRNFLGFSVPTNHIRYLVPRLRYQLRVLESVVLGFGIRFTNLRFKNALKVQEVLEKSNPRTFLILFNKLKSLQRYDIAQNCRILHRVFQHLPQHNLKILQHWHI
jgi:hypothetical protein